MRVFGSKETVLKGVRWGLLIFAALFGLSCKTVQQVKDPIIGPSYVPTNVYREFDALPANVRKVAVLPLSYNERDEGPRWGYQALEPVLQSELAKANKFELVAISPEQLKQWTGKERWDFQEALPPKILQQIVTATGADGVLFSHLSHYKAYPPLLIGWRLKLVTAPNPEVVWSVDEIFDAGEEPVSNAARRFAREHLRNHPTLEDTRSILLSPSRFGRYTASAVMDTLPAR